MKKWNVKKTLIIISIIIIFLGIIVGLRISNELENAILNEKIYVDGSDFSGLTQIGGIIGSKILGIVIVIYSIFIDVLIWFIYGIVCIIVKIIKKINNKKTIEAANSNWSKVVLDHQIDMNLYERKALTNKSNNFKNPLVEPQSDLVNDLQKDPYRHN